MNNAENVDFVVALITEWLKGLVKEKEGESVIIYDNLLPPLHIASYSLLRNMRDALKGTTLN